MNDHEVTRLLERLVDDVPVAPPPVAAVTSHGRRRLLVRRGGQGLVAAAVVTAFTIGGLTLSAVTSRGPVGVAAGPTVTALPGQPPTVAQLLGTWHWVGAKSTAGSSAPAHPTPVTFANHSLLYETKPGASTPLYWSGDTGCKRGWDFIDGVVHLGPGGSFSAGMNFGHNCALVGAKQGSTLGDVLTKARAVRLVDGQLRFYDVHRHLVGTFSKG